MCEDSPLRPHDQIIITQCKYLIDMCFKTELPVNLYMYNVPQLYWIVRMSEKTTVFERTFDIIEKYKFNEFHKIDFK